MFEHSMQKPNLLVETEKCIGKWIERHNSHLDAIVLLLQWTKDFDEFFFASEEELEDELQSFAEAMQETENRAGDEIQQPQ